MGSAQSQMLKYFSWKMMEYDLNIKVGYSGCGFRKSKKVSGYSFIVEERVS